MSHRLPSVTRLPIRLDPDPRRVITRLFSPGDPQRIRRIIRHVLAMTSDEQERLMQRLREDFGARHPDPGEALEANYAAVRSYVDDEARLGALQRQLIGAYFTMEYAIESAALFNPSMVPAADQTDVPPGSTRFLISLRATGEGHLSSIVFRRGLIDADGTLHIDPASPHSRSLKVVADQVYDKETFLLKLIETGGYTDLADTVLDRLGASFALHELIDALERLRHLCEGPASLDATADRMLTLARSNYELEIPGGVDPSEFVIFPHSDSERRGIEDLRLVRFTDDDGSQRYYGTYTAYNGERILPQMLELPDPRTVRVHTLGGAAAQNKGMALFPRKLDGRYVMVSRLDNENLYLMTSDNVRFWNEAEVLQRPRFAWELVQIGNCGSPIETDAGWLLLTHGVGPMRQYGIGATLLDRDDPSRILGQTAEPLMMPLGEERAGYVPNVVYSCGAMAHNGTLIIPYAMSDMSTSFATVRLAELLAALRD